MPHFDTLTGSGNTVRAGIKLVDVREGCMTLARRASTSCDSSLLPSGLTISAARGRRTLELSKPDRTSATVTASSCSKVGG